ncbi:MAG: hypothetical protein WCD18_27865 [Thermosynechococcaceae cyanobacterium]
MVRTKKQPHRVDELLDLYRETAMTRRTEFRQSNQRRIANIVVGAIAMGLPLICRAESFDGIVRIGSPMEWTQYESYWKRLVNLNDDSGDSHKVYYYENFSY